MTDGDPRERNPERRAVRRFVLSLPVEVRLASGQTAPLKGTTRDASSRGLYFVIDREFPLGTELDLILTLPKKITYATEVSLRVYGKVVRTGTRREGNVQRVGIAATMETYYFVRTKPSSP
jgi:hypothetical protein